VTQQPRPTAGTALASGIRRAPRMLRITITNRPEGVTLALEGRLAGPWVHELAGCWKTIGNASAICVQLDAVTFIDAAGKALLRTMHDEGAVLAASGCMTRAILEEIGR